MMTLDMTAQMVPLYWAMIATLVVSASALVASVLPRDLAKLQSRLSSRRGPRVPRLFIPGSAAKVSA